VHNTQKSFTGSGLTILSQHNKKVVSRLETTLHALNCLY
jgi:hypothetical protein